MFQVVAKLIKAGRFNDSKDTNFTKKKSYKDKAYSPLIN